MSKAFGGNPLDTIQWSPMVYVYHIVRTNQGIPIDTDVAVLLLEESPAMDSSVHWVKLLPNSTVNKLPALRRADTTAGCVSEYVPMIATGQSSATWAVDLDSITSSPRAYYASSLHMANWTQTAEAGDGGHPYYLPIKGELVLASHAWFRWNGPNYADLAGDINAAIQILRQTYGGPDEQVQTVNLDDFPDL